MDDELLSVSGDVELSSSSRSSRVNLCLTSMSTTRLTTEVIRLNHVTHTVSKRLQTKEIMMDKHQLLYAAVVNPERDIITFSKSFD